jgi:DDE superfamily endonuclease
MEDVLDLYAEDYIEEYPVVTFDESPYQMISEKRVPLPAEKGKPRRYDYEYKREGTCNLFLFFQPLAGWRHVKVTQRRTTLDFAQCMKDLVDIHFPSATLISVVLDNLNTHTPAALYEAFEPAEARRIVSKLAQYGRMRIRGAAGSVFGSAHSEHRDGTPQDESVGAAAE